MKVSDEKGNFNLGRNSLEVFNEISSFIKVAKRIFKLG